MGRRSVLMLGAALAAVVCTALLWWLLAQSTCPDGFVMVETARGAVCVSGVIPQVQP